MSKIRVRHGEDEIELEGSDDFISARLTAFYEQLPKLTAAPPEQDGTRSAILRPAASKHKAVTPAEFYRSYGAPTDGVSQILVFAKYLEDIEGRSEFAIADVNLAAKNARLAKNIHSQYFSNAVRDGLLRRDQKGLYSLTVSAEERLSKPPGELRRQGRLLPGPRRRPRSRRRPRLASAERVQGCDARGDVEDSRVREVPLVTAAERQIPQPHTSLREIRERSVRFR